MGKRILIIEDDTFLGDVLLQRLKNEDYDAYLARDGAEGFNKIKELKPDLILLDIILPNMDGYEILEGKKKDPEISEIPVIIISNSGQPVEINRALALGIKDYLVKAQFDPDEVLEKVRLQIQKEENNSVLNNAKAQDATQKIASSPLTGKKIMWVEDDDFLSDIIKQKISGQDCALLHIANGKKALEMVEKEMPDLVMLDIVLPDINGLEILQKIKENPRTEHIPVILLSNLGQKNDIDTGQNLKAARFLIKANVTLDEIIEEIKAVLNETAK
jgi:DNA-binding response OmpR family regulator